MNPCLGVRVRYIDVLPHEVVSAVERSSMLNVSGILYRLDALDYVVHFELLFKRLCWIFYSGTALGSGLTVVRVPH